MSSIKFSAGSERRVRQTEPVAAAHDQRPIYHRHHTGHLIESSCNERTSSDRRVASYRGSIDTWISETACHDESCKLAHPKRDLILALRRAPDGVVVAEWDFLDDRPGDDWSICVDGGIDLSQFDGRRVRVLVVPVEGSVRDE